MLYIKSSLSHSLLGESLRATATRVQGIDIVIALELEMLEKLQIVLAVAVVINSKFLVAIEIHTKDISKECHCISNITINIPQCEANRDSLEEVQEENQQLLAELQQLKETAANYTENDGKGMLVIDTMVQDTHTTKYDA